ncbi:hypothetical protein B0H11DRAFT_1035607 [Mycena galericulata]|nr:hypothetical protein B0H11DRAFT_1035607 [Mycena galericulata]
MSLASTEHTCSELETRLEGFGNDRKAIEADSEDDNRFFLGLLAEACNLARAVDVTCQDYTEIVDRINRTINKGVRLGYRRLQFECLPSFAHSDEYPVLEGPHRDKLVFCIPPYISILEPHTNSFVAHRMKEVLEGMERIFKLDPSESRYRFPPPWTTTPKPVSSSVLSRFETDVACPSPACTAIYQARCEISSDRVPLPITLAHGGTCIALPSMGGYKNRTPMLSYYLLDVPAEDSGQDFPLDARHTDVGLADIAYSAVVDGERKLMFVADDTRIKSYAWGDTHTGEVYKSARPMHTLHTSKARGPLAMLASGRFARAGKGFANVWNLDELATHGPHGRARIGGRYSPRDSMRDDDDVIETSAGSMPSTTLSFVDPKLAPATWTAHPSLPGNMICGSDPKKSGDYSCIALDLEHGGATGARYLGCAGEIANISTSNADPSVFVTAADDGYARLYDVRCLLPVLSLSSGLSENSCSAALLVHPEGVPTIFTGAEQDEVIRLWDVRAPKLVYELSTGNTEVTGLAWDSARSVLYASTNCSYMDRSGYTTGYRKANIPKPSPPGSGTENGEDEDDELSGYEDYGDYERRCWPRKAAHAEDYFGHLFDAGEHRILRYAFKDDPDPSILPIYGDATVRSSNW